MTLVSNIAEILVAMGTFTLAGMTYFSIREARRKERKIEMNEERAKKIAFISEQINDFYLPMLGERYKMFVDQSNVNEILRISTTKYILAEQKTKEAIDALFSVFNGVTISKDQSSMNNFAKNIYNSLWSENPLWSSIISDYEELLKNLYSEKGTNISGKFPLPVVRV